MKNICIIIIIIIGFIILIIHNFVIIFIYSMYYIIFNILTLLFKRRHIDHHDKKTIEKNEQHIKIISNLDEMIKWSQVIA